MPPPVSGVVKQQHIIWSSGCEEALYCSGHVVTGTLEYDLGILLREAPGLAVNECIPQHQPVALRATQAAQPRRISRKRRVTHQQRPIHSVLRYDPPVTQEDL